MLNEVVFIVADVMRQTTVFVTGHDTVATASKLIAQHNLTALPVFDSGRIIGLVMPTSLLLASPYRPIREVMIARAITPATPALPLSQAYALMTGQDLDVLPVVDDGSIVGEISSIAILRVQGQQTDPLTGLPFSTAIRAWAVAALERGHEITILFLDLDNFGAVNKVLGHVAGDNVLCTVARLLAGLINVETDVLCRYGGDEFAIATTRRETDARALMQRIQQAVALPIGAGESTRQVTVSIGMSGGRRGEGRKRAHIAATVDDLLTLASRASTAAKEAKRSRETDLRPTAPRSGAVGSAASNPRAAGARSGVAETPEARLRLVGVLLETRDTGSTAAVTLALGEREDTGRASGYVEPPAIAFLVAGATLDAIRRVAGDVHTFVLQELHEVPVAEGKAVAAVLRAQGPPDESRMLVGAARAGDLPHAVTKAILAAINRHLARSLRESRP